MSLFGSVENKIAILVDDIIDTAGTACKAAKTLHDFKALKVYMYACHGLLSNNALEKIKESKFERIVITNTVYLNQHIKNHSKIEILNVSKLCAEVIKRIDNGESLSYLYEQNEPIYTI